MECLNLSIIHFKNIYFRSSTAPETATLESTINYSHVAIDSLDGVVE